MLHTPRDGNGRPASAGGGFALRRASPRAVDGPIVTTAHCDLARTSPARSGERRARRRSDGMALKVVIPDSEERPPEIVPILGTPPRFIASQMGGEALENQSVRARTHGVALRRGRRRTQEDAFCAVPTVRRHASRGFFGVFDGHGCVGRRASEFAASRLAALAGEGSAFEAAAGDPAQTFLRAFAKLDSDFLAEHCDAHVSGGTTALAAYVSGCERLLWVAHVGDSRCVLSRGGRAVQLSADHTPAREDERQRIERAGGRVLHVGTWRVEGVLAISRAIGDRRFKGLVSAVPEVRREALLGEEELLILATDGLWCVMSNQEAVDIAAACGRPGEASDRLADEALARGSTDNVCVVVVDLRAYQHGHAPSSRMNTPRTPLTPRTPIDGNVRAPAAEAHEVASSNEATQRDAPGAGAAAAVASEMQSH